MKTVIPEGMKANGHYVPGMISGNTLYVSGQLPLVPGLGKLAEGGIREQMLQALANVDAVLRAAGCTKENVVKCTVYIPDVALWPEANAAYAEFFGEHKPARVICPCSGLHFGALAEVEAIAEL